MRILCCLGRREFKNVKFHPLPSLPTLTKYFTFYSVSAFSFYLKKKTPAKEKQTQGFAPRPRERRAAVHSLCCSVGSSAHSPVNSLRSNSTDSCGLLRKPSPRSSQTASTTAARLLEACSSGVIKSLTLLFFVFSQTSQARPRVRLRKSGSGLNANPLPPKRFYLMLTLWFISQPVPKNRPTETRSWKMTPVTPKERSFADIEVPNENISPFSPGETIMGT